MDWSKYEELMLKAEFAEFTAKQYAEAQDGKMVTFYMNVAWCYRHRAEQLTIGEAEHV